MTTATVKTKTRMSPLNLVYSAMFAALMMIGANITAFVPFLVVANVPITLQTFFAILAGLLLGSRMGATAMTVYMFIGLAGAPVFSRFSGGFGSIISPTFGFVVSFIFTAYLAGKIVEKDSKLKGYIIAALVGLVVNYVIGTNWMYAAFKTWASAPEIFGYKVAWAMMIPPLPKDIILAVLAGIFGHRMHKVLKVKR
ncbi:biotin transporter BioY [Filibacter tadaridae]|uniref:Biotin transporter n=1 Tax=Filibacter tadaridae TaxID=2483811 RepID=A0A3P5WI16_9BACL|nr:biotin transporter BioY [Filibacter tadaridae]VDC18191.1 Biotin transporter BioY [Filibacter tadaridae]